MGDALQEDAFEALWRRAEARHLTPTERVEYIELTGELERARASEEVRDAEPEVVRAAAAATFERYPIAGTSEHALVKTIRDMEYVSAYATAAMLRKNDTGWLDDKVLIWLRSVLSAFQFPPAAERRTGVLFGAQSSQRSPARMSACHFAYQAMRSGYAGAISAPAFDLMDPLLLHVIDAFAEDR